MTAITPNPKGDVIGVCSRLGCTAPTLNRDECEVHKPRPWDRPERPAMPSCPVCHDLACDEHRP